MKTFPGINVRQHHTDRELMGLLREQCAELRKGHLRFVAIRSGRKMVGGFHGMLLLSAKHSRSLVWWEDTLWETFWECPLTDQWYRLEQWLNVTLFLPKTNREYISLVLKSCQVYLSVMSCTGRVWKGDILVADVEGLEQMDASEVYGKRLNAKEVLTPMSGEKFFQSRMER